MYLPPFLYTIDFICVKTTKGFFSLPGVMLNCFFNLNLVLCVQVTNGDVVLRETVDGKWQMLYCFSLCFHGMFLEVSRVQIDFKVWPKQQIHRNCAMLGLSIRLSYVAFLRLPGMLFEVETSRELYTAPQTNKWTSSRYLHTSCGML